MCGRYSFVPDKSFFDIFEIENGDFEIEEDFNVSPGEIVPVITMNSPKRANRMKWGLIPFWAKDPRIGYKMINARSEDIDKKPSYRDPIKNKRCLIPASGFYEWGMVGKEKWPFYFTLTDREMFAFAGLYDIWKDGEGKEIYSCTIITTQANACVGAIHERMPVILDRKDEEKWIDNSAFSPDVLKLLKPYPADLMKKKRVSTLVNNPKNNGPDLIDGVK